VAVGVGVAIGVGVIVDVGMDATVGEAVTKTIGAGAGVDASFGIKEGIQPPRIAMTTPPIINPSELCHREVGCLTANNRNILRLHNIKRKNLWKWDSTGIEA
jgi:hypothetical protein